MSTPRIPRYYCVVWGILALLFVAALFTWGELSWYLSLLCLIWFGCWEARGIARNTVGDTLSESVWRLLDVQQHAVVNRALYPLVMGVFTGAACMFIGVVEGAAEQSMSVWSRIVATIFIASGTLAFLFRHFRRGDSR